MPDGVGEWIGGALGWLLISVAKVTSGQSDEDIFEGDLAVSNLENSRIIFVLLDEPSGRIDRDQLAIVDDGHPVTHRLRLFHGVGRQEDAAANVTQPFDPIPQLTASLRVQAGGGLVEEHEWRAVNGGNQQGNAFLLPPGKLAEPLCRPFPKMNVGQPVLGSAAG